MDLNSPDQNEFDQLTEDHLHFSALSDGLGLNKKSRTQSQGTGAKLAGPISISSNILKPKAPQPAKVIQQKPQEDVIAKAHISEPGVGLVVRSIAGIIDLAIICGVLFGALRLNFGTTYITQLWQTEWKSLLFFGGLFSASYFLLSESFGGQSLGKMLSAIHVVEDDKYQRPIGFYIAAKRVIFLPLGLLPLGLGLWSSIWESKSRTWHDKVTASIVRYKK